MRTTSRTLRRTAPLAAALASATLVLAACGGGGGAGGGNGGGSAAAGATAVAVDEHEFAIALSTTSLAPGTYTFTVQNTGTFDHALEIDGPGVSDVKTATIAPGESAQLTVTLQDGTYELYCPIDGHREKGMELSVSTGAGGSATTGGATTTEGTTTEKKGGGYGAY